MLYFPHMPPSFTHLDQPKNPPRRRNVWRWLNVLVVVLIVGGGAALVGWQMLRTRTALDAASKAVPLDSDSDGLSDAEEIERGTDIHTDDTDGDGYLDKEEIDHGYDPLTPAAKTAAPIAATNETLPATDLQAQALDGWQTYTGHAGDTRFTFRYPGDWKVTEDENPTLTSINLLDDKKDLRVRVRVAAGTTAARAILDFAGGSTLESNETIRAGVLTGYHVVRTQSGNKSEAYVFEQNGSVYQFFGDKEIEELQTIAATLDIGASTAAALTKPTLVYHIAETKDRGTSALPDDDTVEHRFVRVGPDGANPQTIFTITKKNNDGFGAPSALRYDDGHLLLYRRTQNANDTILLDLNGKTITPQHQVLQAGVAFSGDGKQIAYLTYDAKTKAQTLNIKNLLSGDIVTIAATAAVRGGILEPLAWSADQTAVFGATTDGNGVTRLYRADVAAKTIDEITIAGQLQLHELQLAPDYNYGIGATFAQPGSIGGDVRPPSTLELLTLNEKTNRTLLQSDGDVFGRALISPDGLWVTYEQSHSDTRTIRLLSLSDPTRPLSVQLPGNLLDWTADSKHIIYRTAKQIRVYTPSTNDDRAIITDEVDSAISADPYVVTYVGTFGKKE